MSVLTGVAGLPEATRKVLRNVLLGFVVLDLLVLVAFSVRVDTITTTTTRPQYSSPVTTPGALPSAVPLPPAAPLGGGGVPIADLDPATAPPTSKPTPSASPTTEPTAEPTLPAGSVRTTPCPIEIASSTTDGGLQSLIDFAPAFGPFKDEAFAAAAAYQPLLQLIGPILAKYPALAPTLKPVLTPLLGAWQQLLDQGFAVLGPLYTPYRTTVLEAEAKLAAALAPYAQQLTASPLGGCVIALQNALLHDTTGAARKG